jgi:hypothetical protein
MARRVAETDSETVMAVVRMMVVSVLGNPSLVMDVSGSCGDDCMLSCGESVGQSAGFGRGCLRVCCQT